MRGARNFTKDTIPLSRRVSRFRTPTTCVPFVRETRSFRCKLKAAVTAIADWRYRGNNRGINRSRLVDRNIVVWAFLFFSLSSFLILSLFFFFHRNALRARLASSRLTAMRDSRTKTSFYLFPFVTVCPVNTVFPEKHSLLKSRSARFNKLSRALR